MESQYQDLNVYTTKPVSGKGVVQKVNQHQLFDLKRSLGDPDPTVSVPTLMCQNTKLSAFTHIK